MIDKYEQQGIAWLKGDRITTFNDLQLNAKQIEFLNDKHRYSLVSGGMASGKTTAFIIKFILMALFFPGSHHLIGRKTKENAENTFMKDFMEICPEGLYTHSKGYHKITFTNGSEAEFWGLDALQSGATSDIAKAEQQLKSHNFHFTWTDQLEEIEKRVFVALDFRTRANMCKHAKSMFDVIMGVDKVPVGTICRRCGKATFNQMNSTTNPANFWGYDFFKVNPNKFSNLVETSMMDNKQYLSEQYIQSQLAQAERHVRKYVYGEWSPDSLVESAVFDEEHIKEQMFYGIEPIRELNGIKIYKEPALLTYQVGVDPSDGSIDPCSIQVICKETGELVATYSGNIPHSVIADKAVTMALMYSVKDKPLIVPEATGAGQALVEHLKMKWDNIYVRKIYNVREARDVNKLGFSTNYATKSILIEDMKELFKNHFPKIYDKPTIEELKTFIYSDEVRRKGAGAQVGYHDDRIMALMLAFCEVKGSRAQAVETQHDYKLQALRERVRSTKTSYE